MICAFFGHKNVPDGLGGLLEKEIGCIIEIFGSDTAFYVGDKGHFDRLVQLTLTKMKDKYPEIEVYVVLDNIPERDNYFSLPTILPDGFESVPARFAMAHRNKWMTDKCDLAVVYFNDVASNTRKHVDMLKSKNKPIINIADLLAENLDNPFSLC